VIVPRQTVSDEAAAGLAEVQYSKRAVFAQVISRSTPSTLAMSGELLELG
jgi:hypothetical protein